MEPFEKNNPSVEEIVTVIPHYFNVGNRTVYWYLKLYNGFQFVSKHKNYLVFLYGCRYLIEIPKLYFYYGRLDIALVCFLFRYFGFYMLPWSLITGYAKQLAMKSIEEKSPKVIESKGAISYCWNFLKRGFYWLTNKN